MKRVLLVALLAIASTAPIARGDDEPVRNSYRAVVDRVDLEPAAITGYRLRVYLSALAIEGQILDLTDPKSIRLYVGSGEKKFPYALGTFEQTDSNLAMVVILQATSDFSTTLPIVVDALDRELLAKLGEHAQVAVMTYGESSGTGKLLSPKTARGKLGELGSEPSAGDPALLDTLDRALQLLRRAKTNPEGQKLRKMIVVVGDGRSQGADKERTTLLGEKASKEGVRIHSIAYSPNDVRRPLLFLGELSKKSLGTFRWPGRGRPPTTESWGDAFKQLHEEVTKQYVLTYFVGPDEEVAGKKLHVVTVGRTEATSNDVKIPSEPACGKNPCATGYCASDRCVQIPEPEGRGVLGWIVLVGGIGVGALVVLGFVGWLMSRQKTPKAPKPPKGMPMPGQFPGAPGMPGQFPGAPGMPMPGQFPGAPAAMLPSGRPVPSLLISSGPRTGERLYLRNGFLVGKQPGCDLQIDDGYTSSQHAQFAMDHDGNCRLYDRGSTNGTYVNGARISEQQLDHGVVIRIGGTEMRFLAQ